MKKIIYLLALVLLMPSVMASIEFYDDFNYSSEDIQGWYVIDENPPFGGSISVDNAAIINSSGSDVSLQIKKALNDTTNDYVAFEMNVSCVFGSDCLSVDSWIGLNNGSFEFARVGINNHAWQYYNRSAWVNISTGGNSTVNDSQIYFFEIVIDYASQTYDIYVDNNAYSTDVRFSYYDHPDFGPMGSADRLNNITFSNERSGVERILTIPMILFRQI